jgi:hypothetical protein
MIYSVVLVIIILGTATAFLPYPFSIYITSSLLQGQDASAQGDNALEDTSDGAEPTGEGGTEGTSDDAEDTGGGSQDQIGPADEAPGEDDGIGNGENGYDAYYCENAAETGSKCFCHDLSDCVQMALSGQCKKGTWDEKTMSCEWNV